MSRISTNRNRSRYTYNDRQPMTKEAKQEFRQAEAELMARNCADREAASERMFQQMMAARERVLGGRK